MSKYPSSPCSYYLTAEASEARLSALVSRLVRERNFDLGSDFFKVPESIQARVMEELADAFPRV